MIGDLIALLAVPFVTTLVLLAIHAWFGLHILRRKVIFADLALAQTAAFGATLAVALGHGPGELVTFSYSLLFALSGAALLTASRSVARAISPEAFIGILYVVATAATVLTLDRAPQGAEHVKRMLVGTLLSVGLPELMKIVPLYAGIALLHVLARRPLRRASEALMHGSTTALWDFVFYASFAVVVTSSVALAGVLLVFSLLIIPAVIGMLFAQGMLAALLIGWFAGLLASVGGFTASLVFDMPVGASLVLALAGVLGWAGVFRLLFHGEPAMRRRNRHRAWRGALAGVLVVTCAGSAWSLLRPDADQPLLMAFEMLGLRPERFLHPGQAAQYAESQQTETRYRQQIDALTTTERRARWQGTPLTDEEVRRIASYQQTYNEMARGERFVQDYLLARARQRERWLVSLPIGILAAVAMALLYRADLRRLWQGRLTPHSSMPRLQHH